MLFVDLSLMAEPPAKKANLDETPFVDRFLTFMDESEKLKTVARSVDLSGPGTYNPVAAIRKESSAEHSWHLAIMAMLLQQELQLSDSDQLKLLRMLLVHDLPEVYCGDMPLLAKVVTQTDGTVVEDPEKTILQHKEESKAADVLFGLLPKSAASLKDDWEQFEARLTPLSRVAKVLDKLAPLLQNRVSDGKDYKAFKSTLKTETDLLEPHLQKVGDHSILRTIAERLLHDAKESGWLEGEAAPTESVIVKAALIYTDSAGHVLVARNKGVDKFFLPGGQPEKGESMEDTLFREIHEELSVVIKPSSLRFLGVHRGNAYGQNPPKRFELHLYSGTFLDGFVPRAASEVEEIRYISAGEAQNFLPPLAAKVVKELEKTGLVK